MKEWGCWLFLLPVPQHAQVQRPLPAIVSVLPTLISKPFEVAFDVCYQLRDITAYFLYFLLLLPAIFFISWMIAEAARHSEVRDMFSSFLTISPRQLPRAQLPAPVIVSSSAGHFFIFGFWLTLIHYYYRHYWYIIFRLRPYLISRYWGCAFRVAVAVAFRFRQLPFRYSCLRPRISFQMPAFAP